MINLYRSLYLIRTVEERIAEVYPTDKVKSPVHLSIGQEFVSVGVCAHLKPEDVVFGYYRSHAMYLAKGGSLRAMIAELYGKSTGCCRGKGGSMHLSDVSHGIVGISAVVGTQIPEAAGYAYAQKLKNSGNITVCFLGDGATEEGVFYETLNWAVLKSIPLLLVCENNGYAINTSLHSRQAFPILNRVNGFGMDTGVVRNGCVRTLHTEVKQIVENIRTEGKPFFLEVACSRWKQHVGPNEDFRLGFRPESEVTEWQAKDQLIVLEKLVGDQAQAIRDSVDQEIEDAFLFAENSKFPDRREVATDVYR